MKIKKLFIVVGIILLIGLIVIVAYYSKVENKKLTKKEVLELINKRESYKNIQIKTKIEDNIGNITNIEFLKKDNLELYSEKSERGERIEWTDTNKSETLVINPELKYYEVLKNYEKQTMNNNYSECNYKFIAYEKYNNVECVVVKFIDESLSEDTIWIDLNTGFVLKKIVRLNYNDENSHQRIEYSEVLLDSVTDEIVSKPDVSNYSTQLNLEQFENYL